MTPPCAPVTANCVTLSSILLLIVRTSPSNIVTPLDARFSSVLSETPSSPLIPFDDSPCFRINPDTAPIPPVTVNVLTSGTDSTM
jgi:hypothetical protein